MPQNIKEFKENNSVAIKLNKRVFLERFSDKPILSPNQNDWENLVTTNPGAWYEDGNVMLLYRAMGTNEDSKISFGLAESCDGINFTRSQSEPVFEPSKDGWDAGCIEDPRIVKMDGTFYITYAARPYPPTPYWHRVKGDVIDYVEKPVPLDAPKVFSENRTMSGLAFTNDFKTFTRAGRITKATLDDRDVIIFPEKVQGKYVMVHRPNDWVGSKYGTMGSAMWISCSDDLLTWEKSRLLLQAEFAWEGFKVGTSTPPVKTRDGWLMLYHAVTEDIVYRVGAVLLDLEDPTRVIGRSRDFILEPELDFERFGVVDNVVFPCGNVVIDDLFYVYYGGADKYCGVAGIRLEDLLTYLKQ